MKCTDKYAYVDSNSCDGDKKVCQAALVSVPIYLTSDDNTGFSNHVHNVTNNGTIRHDWCFEFYYFITNNRSIHQFDVDIFVDKPPDFAPGSVQHSLVVSEQPEWTLSSTLKENPLAMSSGQWRQAQINLELSNGMHQLTVLAHLNKGDVSSNGADDHQIVVAIDVSRLYKGMCVGTFPTSLH